jgi:hypothetical protein
VAEAHIVKGFIQLSTEEEQFARVFNRIGPFIAIGDPREALPDLGAVRLYVGNEAWKEKVEALLAHARLVVVRLSATEGHRCRRSEPPSERCRASCASTATGRRSSCHRGCRTSA